jgi:hypothetical protein
LEKKDKKKIVSNLDAMLEEEEDGVQYVEVE